MYILYFRIHRIFTVQQCLGLLGFCCHSSFLPLWIDNWWSVPHFASITCCLQNQLLNSKQKHTCSAKLTLNYHSKNAFHHEETTESRVYTHMSSCWQCWTTVRAVAITCYWSTAVRVTFNYDLWNMPHLLRNSILMIFLFCRTLLSCLEAEISAEIAAYCVFSRFLEF